MNRSIVEKLKNDFNRAYGPGNEDIQAFYASGRVNLIGEHTDYNGGWVMPFAIPFGTWLFIRKSREPLWKFRSLNQKMVAQVLSDKVPERVGNTWINYPLGVIREFLLKGSDITGLEFLYWGNIPNGSGLSSSASIEMVTAIALDALFACNLEMTEKIRLTQRAENNFVGVNCGIMDMFAIGFGKKGKVLALNCDTLEYQLLPALLPNHQFIVTNTKKERRLSGSEYNQRRAECNKAVEILRQRIPIENLSQIKPADWDEVKHSIPDEVLRRRANHVISENQRVLEVMDALTRNDVTVIGQKMVESHSSLRDDFEVSCFELDTLVEEALKIDGVKGSRMTGAGFGGCTISLVQSDQTETYKEVVSQNYFQKTGINPEFYVAEPVDGIMNNITL